MLNEISELVFSRGTDAGLRKTRETTGVRISDKPMGARGVSPCCVHAHAAVAAFITAPAMVRFKRQTAPLVGVRKRRAALGAPSGGLVEAAATALLA